MERARSSLHLAACCCLSARQLQERPSLQPHQESSHADSRENQNTNAEEAWTYPCGECVLDGQTGRVSYVEPGLLARQLLNERVHVPSLNKAK